MFQTGTKTHYGHSFAAVYNEERLWDRNFEAETEELGYCAMLLHTGNDRCDSNCGN